MKKKEMNNKKIDKATSLNLDIQEEIDKFFIDEYEISKEILESEDPMESYSFITLNPGIDEEKHIDLILRRGDAQTCFNLFLSLNRLDDRACQKRVFHSKNFYVIRDYMEYTNYKYFLDYVDEVIDDCDDSEWKFILNHYKPEYFSFLQDKIIKNKNFDKAFDLATTDKVNDKIKLEKLIVDSGKYELMEKFYYYVSNADFDLIQNFVINSKNPVYAAKLLFFEKSNKEVLQDIIIKSKDPNIVISVLNEADLYDRELPQWLHLDAFEKIILNYGSTKQNLKILDIGDFRYTDIIRDKVKFSNDKDLIVDYLSITKENNIEFLDLIYNSHNLAFYKSIIAINNPDIDKDRFIEYIYENEDPENLYINCYSSKTLDIDKVIQKIKEKLPMNFETEIMIRDLKNLKSEREDNCQNRFF